MAMVSENIFKEQKEIVILGAGIAGLVAGYELKKKGYTVKIYEASDRIGGRVFTKYFNPDLYGELGAMRIPDDHELVLHYIKELGLCNKLRRFKTVFNEDNCYADLNNKIYRIDKVIKELSLCYLNRFDQNLKSETARKYITGLKILIEAISPVEIRELFTRDLYNGLAQEIDTLFCNNEIKYDEEEVTFRNILKHADKFLDKVNPSLQLFLRDIILETKKELYRLEGGMSIFPEALAQFLKEEIHLNKPVSGISVLGDEVHIEFNDGDTIISSETICTIPYSVLKNLKLSGFSDSKLRAINDLKYADASKVLFLCKERFWENEKHKIKSGASITDNKLRQVYYPDNESKTKEGVLLGSYAIGGDSKEIASMRKQDRLNEVKELIGRFHPEIKENNMVLKTESISWEDHKWTLGGCSVMWNGENDQELGDPIDQLYEDIIKPEGNLFFAGEHCSEKQAWIEGAIRSSLEQIEAITKKDLAKVAV